MDDIEIRNDGADALVERADALPEKTPETRQPAAKNEGEDNGE